MTTSIKVMAHCDEKTVVDFGVSYTGRIEDIKDIVTLQDGEKVERVIYGNIVAIIMERPKRK